MFKQVDRVRAFLALACDPFAQLVASGALTCFLRGLNLIMVNLYLVAYVTCEARSDPVFIRTLVVLKKFQRVWVVTVVLVRVQKFTANLLITKLIRLIVLPATATLQYKLAAF